MKKLFWISVIIFFSLTACNAAGLTPEETATPPATETHSMTGMPEPTLTQTPEPGMPATITPSGTEVCMPLEGETYETMVDLISNPYDPPEIGVERVHQGLDFAVTDPVTGAALTGASVQAVLGGRVVTVLQDRFPYGTTVLIETELTTLSLPPNLTPDIPPAPLQFSSLNCPEGYGDYQYAFSGSFSLYMLYAHLEDAAPLMPGDHVEACALLGTVGMSGNALNPHLHLEVRMGPSGLAFSSMAHYDNSASLDEMANYCFWRVSGFYHFVDPLVVLSLVE